MILQQYDFAYPVRSVEHLNGVSNCQVLNVIKTSFSNFTSVYIVPEIKQQKKIKNKKVTCGVYCVLSAEKSNLVI